MKVINSISLLLICAIFYLTSCNTQNGSENTLPPARGAANEVILVMDSAAWQGELGEALRETFMKAVPGLPQPEPYFDLRYVSPFALNSVLRSAKNMLFITTLNDQSRAAQKMRTFFTENSLERIRQDTSLFMYEKKDEFARGQEVLHLFGADQQSLVNHIRENQEQIRQKLTSVEQSRLTSGLYAGNEQKSVSNQLLKEYGFYVRIPFGYDMVSLPNAQDFVWIRQLDRVDKSIVVTFKNYTSENELSPDSIMAFRQQQLGRYISDDPTTYMTVQALEEVEITEFDTVNFNGKFAIETRGLWKLSNNSMGGPFVSYTFVDEDQNRLYYIEGFVYNPGEKKRSAIFELEAILRTFRTPSEQQSAVRVSRD